MGSRRVGGVRADSVGRGELRFGFPRCPRSGLSAVCDAMVQAARSGGFATVSVWTASAEGPSGLGPRLVARGFEYGWQAHWMGLGLGAGQFAASAPSGVEIVWDDSVGGVPGLPYGDDADAEILRIAGQGDPDSVWCCTALVRGNVVGRAVGFRTSRCPGFLGVYSMGVVPDQRRRGVGTALIAGLASRAVGAGCTGLVLNSAADRFYSSFGFESLGRGQTWWMHRPQLESPGLDDNGVALVEAVGDGDWGRLAQFENAPDDLFHVKLSGGMTLPGLALRCRRWDVFDWLEERGVAVDLLEAWKRGGRRRAARLLGRDPDARDRRGGPHAAPPLHRAVAAGDRTLVEWLLANGVDRGALDGQFGGTAARWAMHTGHPELIPLLS